MAILREDPSLSPAARPRLAYLNTRYPALSHTFVQREIEALRGLGVEIVPFSIRRPQKAELGEGADSRELDQTVFLLDGARRVVWRFLRSLTRAPVRVARTIVSSQVLAPSGQRMRHLAYAVEAISLGEEMRQRGLSAVHVHMANNGAMVALLATRFDNSLSYSLTIHGSAEFFDVSRLRLREKAESAVFVRCISEFCRSQVMIWTSPSAWNRLHVVHCGVVLPSFAKRPTMQPQVLRVLTVGRLVPIKGYPLLLDALCRAGGEGLPWALRIAGDGPERTRLADLVSELGIGEHVRFLGPLSPVRVQQELGDADVLVVSSLMEGVPVVLMEAMAAGVPVVSTLVGGVAELVEDGYTGRLMTPGSTDEMARVLGEIWERPAEAAERAVAARQKVEEEFDVQLTGPKMLQLLSTYGQLGNGRSTSGKSASGRCSDNV